MKHNVFYIKLLYKPIYFINNVICSWNLFLVLLISGSCSICLNDLKVKQIYINSSLILEKKIQDFNKIRKM